MGMCRTAVKIFSFSDEGFPSVFSCPSLFFPFSSLVLGWGFCFGFGGLGFFLSVSDSRHGRARYYILQFARNVVFLRGDRKRERSF